MVRNYFRLIFRNLTKRIGFTLINVLGLSMAFAVCFIVLVYAYTEFSYDKQIPDFKNKYRITICKSNEQMANLPYNLKEFLEPQLPQGSELAVVSTNSSFTSDEVLISYNQNFYKIKNSILADNRILTMLGISLSDGSADCSPDSPNQILISQNTSQTIFGNKNAIGRLLKLGKLDYTVSGVFKELPANTHLAIELITLRPLDWQFNYDQQNSWGYNMFDYYLRLPELSNVKNIESAIRNIYLSANPSFKNASEKEKAEIIFKLEPIADIHLHSSQIKWDNNKIKGSMELVIVFIVVGILILLMAVFNYINLSIAFFQTKNTFSGNLKVFGASSCHLNSYIYLQTTLVVLFGIIGSLVIVRVLLPLFNTLVSRQLSFNLLLNPIVIGFSLLIIFFIIFLAGLYPAYRFSRQTPVNAFKRILIVETSYSKYFFRKIMVVSQFTISISLLITILFMGRQIRLMSQQNLGFNSDQLIEIKSFVRKNDFNLLKSRLEHVSNVASVSIANYTPGSYIADGFPLRLSNASKDTGIDGSTIVQINWNYFDVMKIKQLQGETISSTMEDKNIVFLSKTAAEKLGMLNPIGEKIYYSGNFKDYLVAGVVDDVQYRSFREMPKPILYSLGIFGGSPVLRLIKGDHVKTIADIKEVWNSIFPDRMFDFSFFDSKLQSNYQNEINTHQLLNMLMIISLVIALMGIYGLIMEIAIQRTKEVGIRKVNGAKISEILTLLTKDFGIWVIIAFVIATPISWYIMHKWLESFAYKTDLSWWIFALAGLLALIIALITVSWQSWKAATRNPVEALRYE